MKILSTCTTVLVFTLIYYQAVSQDYGFVWKLMLDRGNGTAFFVHEDGYLLTAAHNFSDGKYNGKLIDNWKYKNFKIKHPKIPQSLTVKIVSSLCHNFYEDKNVCNDLGGYDVALLKIVDQENLKKLGRIEVPELFLRYEKFFGRTIIVGYAASKEELEPIPTLNFRRVSPKDEEGQYFIQTNNEQWFSPEVRYHRVVGGFSGGPVLRPYVDPRDIDGNTVYDIIGIQTSVYENDKGFAEIMEKLIPLLLRMEVIELRRGRNFINKLKAGKSITFNDINELKRLEAILLLNYFSTNPDNLDKKVICKCLFKFRYQKEGLNIPYLDRILIQLIKQNIVGRHCEEDIPLFASFADFLFKNYEQFEFPIEALNWSLDLYDKVEKEEISRYSEKIQIQIYQTYAALANKIGTLTQDRTLYQLALEKYLLAGKLATEQGFNPSVFAEAAGLLYSKTGDVSNGLDMYKRAYFAKNTDGSTKEIEANILHLHRKRDGKNYSSKDIMYLLNQGEFKDLSPPVWEVKIMDLENRAPTPRNN